MIELRVNSIPLDLAPDVSVGLDVNNPIFAEDVIPGTFSLPFDLPASPANRRLFGFPELIHHASKPQLIFNNVELWIEGVPWKRGELIFRGFANDRYRVNFQTNTSLLAELFNDVNIRDLDHNITPLVNWDSGSAKYLIAERNDLPNPMTVTINGRDFTDDAISDATRFTNIRDKINDADIGITCSIYVAPDSGENHIITLQADEKGLDQPFEIDLHQTDPPQWINIQSYLDDYEPAVEGFIADLSSQTIDDDFVMPETHIDNFYEGIDNTMLKGIFNHADSAGEFLFKDITGLFTFYSFIPMYTLRYVFGKIEAKTGITFVGDFIDHPLYSKLIFFNTHSLDFFEHTYNGIRQHTYADEINPANHLPDMSVNDLLLELKNLFCLGIDYNEDDKTVEIFFLHNLIDSQSYVDNNRFGPGYEIEYNIKKGIIVGYKWDEEDTAANLSGSDYENVQIGEGEIDVVSQISTTRMQTRLRGQTFAVYKVPVVSRKGSWYGEDPEGPPRLLIYHGNQLDSLNNNYRFASSDNLTYAGIQLGDNTLAVGGEYGLYEQLWKGWADFLVNDIPSNRVAHWSIADLLNFDFKKKYRIDQVRHFVRRLTFNVNNRLNPLEAELMKAE